MDFQLTEEQKAVRNLARDFATKELVPHVEEWEAEGVFHREIIEKMGAQGLYGCAFPEDIGGTAMGFLAQVLIIEEVTRLCLEAGYSFNVQGMLVPQGFYNWGSEEQRQKYVPKLLRGEMVGCFSLTEPDCGSDAAAIKTRAIRDGDSYIINGTKMWATYGSVADVILLIAKTQPELGARGASAFAIETKDLKGFTAAKVPSNIGTRCVPSAELIFDNCRIPASWLVHEEGQGFKVALNSLDYGRITVPARSVAIAQAATDRAIQYANERTAFGQQIGKFQMIQHLIADMVVETEAARLMIYRTASLADQGQPFTREASQGKYFATEVGVRVTERAMEIFGGYAFADEYPIHRLLMAAKVMHTGEGSANIQRILIAEDALGYKRMSRHAIKPRFAVESATL
jgi:alkylation response protein AidB-like acyl-CoA dehydrogenase